LGGVPLPSSYLEFEARRLEEEIGYIRFNAFHPDLTPEMVAAVQSMQDAPGIIIDLRGNPGGSIPPGETLLGQFIEEQTRVATLKTRQGARDWIIQPADEPYEGAVIILIDPLSFSQSEWFASSMQAIGRAVIVGVRSPGGVTGANLARLPNGALLMYPVVQVITPAGVTLEGQGVIPDLEVGLDRDLLLQGIDSQLAAAIAYIEGQDTQ
jgi:carboxyl-terminal processing protease